MLRNRFNLFAIGGLLDAPDTNAGGGDAPSPPSSDTPESGKKSKTVATTQGPPTRGRIVEFTSNEQDAETYPAIVTKVDGDQLHLCVFDAVFGPRLYVAHLRNAAGPGTGAGRWNWPARV